MARQYPNELYIGQKIFVQLDPTSHAIPALVAEIDHQQGLVHVNPIGYKIRWIAKARAISTDEGLFLHFDDRGFFFEKYRALM